MTLTSHLLLEFEFTWICVVHVKLHTGGPEFLIGFEAWDKLAQKWLVCAPLGIHLEPINKEVMLLVTL